MIFQSKPGWPYHVSCGGVVYRDDGRNMQVALLKSHKQDKFPWHLPKGTLEDNETLEHGAGREVEEETGLIGRIEKVVHYFLLRFEKDSNAGMDGEYADCVWLDIDEAQTRLEGSYKSEGEIIARAKTWLTKHAA